MSGSRLRGSRLSGISLRGIRCGALCDRRLSRPGARRCWSTDDEAGPHRQLQLLRR
ncbi:MAG: hypothetical protein ACR2LP_00030 [Candidatus Limnocylindrales bacterium]